jgi:hypothetical protein
MATSWTDVSPADVTSVGTTEKFTSSISIAPNEGLSLDVQSGSHGTDDITVALYASNDGGTTWAKTQEFTIPSGDTDAKSLGLIIGAPDVRLGFVASGSTDTPTLSTRAKRGPLNGA